MKKKVERIKNRGSVRIKKITRNKTRMMTTRIKKIEGIRREKIRNQGKAGKTSKTRSLMMSVQRGERDVEEEEEEGMTTEAAEILT